MFILPTLICIPISILNVQDYLSSNEALEDWPRATTFHSLVAPIAHRTDEARTCK